MGELYKLNFSNGKSYIGIAFASAQTRFIRHRREAMRGKVNALYNAWRKHGEPNLQVLAIIETHLLHEMEIRAISTYRSFSSAGYNMTLGGEGMLGWNPSLETRAKIGAAAKARVWSPEMRAKCGDAARNPSPERRAKISAASKARVWSPETRAKMSASGMGKAFSPETLAKLSAASKGRVQSPEARAKVSAARKGSKGIVPSPETRARLSAALTQHWARHRVEMKKVQP